MVAAPARGGPSRFSRLRKETDVFERASRLGYERRVVVWAAAGAEPLSATPLVAAALSVPPPLLHAGPFSVRRARLSRLLRLAISGGASSPNSYTCASLSPPHRVHAVDYLRL